MKIKWNEFEILNGRPEGMEYDEYRRRLTVQKFLLKLHKQFGIPGTNINPHEEVVKSDVEASTTVDINPEGEVKNNSSHPIL